MKPKNCLIFGGSGQIGRNLIRKLTKNNYKVTVVTRNSHQKGYIIKTQANAGYIEIVEANIFDEKKRIERVYKVERTSGPGPSGTPPTAPLFARNQGRQIALTLGELARKTRGKQKTEKKTCFLKSSQNTIVRPNGDTLSTY